MTQKSERDADIPTSLKEPLQLLCNRLADALGERLSSVVLYGELAKTGEYNRRSSVVNIMVVLSQVSVEILDTVASCIPMVVGDLRLSPMVLSEKDLRSSTDVFPTKFLDMQRHHLVLWGADLLSDLPIARDHIRLRCEQEIKNLMLRLRQLYVQRSKFSEAIENTLFGAASSLSGSLRVLIDLKTGDMPPGEQDVIDALDTLGLDSDVFSKLLALKRGELELDTPELKELYDDCMRFVQKAAELIDTL